MKKLIVSAMLVATLSGCASRYTATPYLAPAEPVKSVALAQDIAPKEASAFEVASVGSNFGLIGALIDAGVQGSRKDRVNEALSGVQFDAEKEMQAVLTEALQGKNIQVTMLTGEDRKKREFLLKYPQNGGGQPVLDVVLLNYGYISAGAGQPWRPTVLADVRMVDASGKQTLLKNRIAYNVVNPQQGVITLYPDPQYVFGGREDMITNPEKLAEGLRVALKAVAAESVKLIQ
jgi:hypothetical protein